VRSACKNPKGIDSYEIYQDNNDNPIESEERFKLRTVKDLFKPRIKREFIIDELVIAKSLNLWFGRYGHKKTFVAISAALHVAAGREWLGLKTKQCPVLFINEDDGEDGLMDRLEAGLRGESLDNENIPLFHMSLSGFNFLKNSEDIGHLKYFIDKTESKLVFIDALDDIASGFDENSVKDLQPLFIELRKVAIETDSAIVILHHSNKKGDIRGSTAIPGGADSSIKIESDNGSQTIKITTDKIRFTKQFTKNATITYISNKDDSTFLEKFYIVEGEETPFDDNKINDKQKKILDYMKNHNSDLAITEFLQDYPDKTENQSYRNAAYALRDKDIIKKNEEKSKHNYTVFSVC
jgi:RecA-family ATPase